jgi:zinc/manganese transport system substrate-binding protein
MNIFVRIVLVLIAFAWLPARADLNIFSTVPEWAALAQEIGGDKVKVYSATNALQDPHHVEARPSLIARARSADLVIATGAELEVGWLPLVLQQSGNAKVRAGQPGYFEASAYVPLLGKPAKLDRAEGDVHPAGDPHIQTDPRNIARVASELGKRMVQLDPANASTYQSRLAQFSARWSASIASWEKQAAVLKGAPIVVQHRAFTYLEAWLGLREVAALEPKPGMEPTTAHLSSVLDTLQKTPAKMVIRAAYQSPRASEWVAERAKINAVALPFTVGGTDAAKDLFGLFDDTIARLVKGAS